jgi:cell division protein FtsL
VAAAGVVVVVTAIVVIYDEHEARKLTAAAESVAHFILQSVTDSKYLHKEM